MFFCIFTVEAVDIKQDWKPFQSQDDEYKWYDTQDPYTLFLSNSEELEY